MKEGIFWPRSKLFRWIVSLWAFLNNGCYLDSWHQVRSRGGRTGTSGKSLLCDPVRCLQVLFRGWGWRKWEFLTWKHKAWWSVPHFYIWRLERFPFKETYQFSIWKPKRQWLYVPNLYVAFLYLRSLHCCRFHLPLLQFVACCATCLRILSKIYSDLWGKIFVQAGYQCCDVIRSVGTFLKEKNTRLMLVLSQRVILKFRLSTMWVLLLRFSNHKASYCRTKNAICSSINIPHSSKLLRWCGSDGDRIFGGWS